MCGIAGVVGIDDPEGFMHQMADSIRHRGPDGEGFFVDADARVALVHRRLAIIDLSDAASQPMLRDPGLALTYNGEIYDYIELRQELQTRGHVFRTQSDTEVILAAYQEFGPACVTHMNGMFSFAIWDAERRVLFCARDRLGEKPFQYTRTADGGFAFASEAKALGMVPGVVLAPDPSAIGAFLQHGLLDAGDASFFAGVESLPAGHTLTFHATSARVQIERYWAPHAAADMDRSEDELIARLEDLLTDSVRIRLRSDVPVGTSLSGGLDSSVIVGLAARTGAKPHSFSARSPGWVEDEGRYMQAVRDHLGLVGHETTPDPTAVPGALGDILWHQEAPIGSLSVYAQWCVMRLARANDVTVLLDGQGADELFAGYPTFLSGHVTSLLATGRVRQAASDSLAILRRFGPRASSAAAVRKISRGARRRFPQLAPYIAAGWAARSHVDLRTGSAPRDLASSQDRALRSTVLPSLLRYADRNSMAFGREVRLPYLDHRLVEFALGLPDGLRVNRAEQKVALRRVGVGLVPGSVLARTDKVGFSVPQTSWLCGPLKDWAISTLTDVQSTGRPWIDRAGLTDVARGLDEGRQTALTPAWRLISTELWARRFVDGAAASLAAEPERVLDAGVAR